MSNEISAAELEAIAKDAAYLVAALRGTQSLDPRIQQANRVELAACADDLEARLKPTGLLKPWRREGGRLGIW